MNYMELEKKANETLGSLNINWNFAESPMDFISYIAEGAFALEANANGGYLITDEVTSMPEWHSIIGVISHTSLLDAIAHYGERGAIANAMAIACHRARVVAKMANDAETWEDARDKVFKDNNVEPVRN